MKKIITALTVTAMALSAAFADVSLEFTQHAIVLGDNGDLDFNGYSGKFDGNGTADGNWKFQFKNANAGVWLTVKPTLQDEKNAVKASEYAGWTKFFDGAMTLQAGQWEARTANRFTGLAGKIQGTQYERYKMGTTGIKFAGRVKTDKEIDSPATDSNRLTDKKLAAQVNYKMDSGAWVTAVLKDLRDENDNTAGDYDPESGIGQKAGIAAEFGTPLGEGSKLIIDFKNFAKNQYVVAGFFENSTLKDGLSFVAGFTFGRNNNKVNNKPKNNVEWGIDFRGTYELADNLLLTTMNNLTYNGYVSDPSLHLWDMVSLSTAVSEQLTAIFSVHWEHKNLWKDSDAAAAEADFATFDIAPMVKYQVGKGVDLTGGLSLRTSNWANRKPTTMTFEIPLMLHVSM